MTPRIQTPAAADILSQLQANRDAMRWDQRAELAGSLLKTVAAGRPPADTLELIYFLAADPKPEVRKEIADLIHLLPEKDFARLTARMMEDGNSYVRASAERAYDRRCGVTKRRSKRPPRDGFYEIQDLFMELEKAHGRSAALKARRIAQKQFASLVGATVHNLRGVMTPLVSGIDGLIRDGGGKKLPARVITDSMLKMQERMRLLTRFINDLQTFSHVAEKERRCERIADVVREATTLVLENLDYAIVSKVELESNVPAALTSCICRYQIVAALVHVIKNAYESFEHAKGPERKITILARKAGDRQVEIVVQDTGPGLDPVYLEELLEFAPGKTTKKNRGTGFGLPTAYRYVAANGGNLVMVSSKGTGTSVTMTLPFDDEGDYE